MLWRMQPRWLDDEERAAWLRLVGVVELLPGVLDTQLRQDSGLSHFEYFSLAMLSEAPDHTLRMGALAQRTNATLPRLSHVISRLESRGWDTVVAAAPGHVDAVRHFVLDPLTREQLRELTVIGDALLARLDPEGRMFGHVIERPAD